MSAVLDSDHAIALCGAHLRNADESPAKSAGVLVTATNALVTALGLRGKVVPQKEHGVDRVPFVPLACALARRSAWESVGALDEGYRFYFEDYDLCWRLGRDGHTIAVCWDAHALHVGGASSSAHDPQRWFTQYHESRARYLRKRGGAGFVAYVVLWPPVALAHALQRLLRRGPGERRWAAAYVAAATAGIGRQASNARQASSKSSS
jgi:GT2 family glycosyltransferase